MRVVIYGINYAPEVAGVGRYTGQIGAQLTSLGHDVCVITAPPHYPGWALQPGSAPWRWTRESVERATVYRCPLYLKRGVSGFRRLLVPLSWAISSAPVALWQILRRRPHLVLLIEPALFAAPVGLLAARLVGARVVLHVQDLEVEAAFAVGHLGKSGPLQAFAAAFDRTVSRAFDTVITISNKMAGRIAAKGVCSERIKVIRNWVDTEQIRPLEGPSPYRAELGLVDGQFVVLYAGNLGVKQGIRVVIEAARALVDRADIFFVVAGEGPMRPALEAAAKDLPNLLLLPFQPEGRMCDFLGLADVHVLPQERDTADLLLPSKLGGMLASGKPILVTADPGTELRDFLEGACEFTPPGDAAALAHAICVVAAADDPEIPRARRSRLASSLSKLTLIDDFLKVALAGERSVPPECG